MSKLKELREKRSAAFQKVEELRSATDGVEMTAEQRASWEKCNADFDKFDREIHDEEKYLERAAKFNGSREQPDEFTDETDEQRSSREFRTYLTTGERPQTRGEKIEGQGKGIIVPQLLSSQVDVALKEFGGVMSVANILVTATGNKMTIPTINDTARKAMILEEYSKTQSGKLAFGSVDLNAYTYRTVDIPVSMELLQDNAVNIEQLIARLISESFNRGLNEDFTKGSGVDKPEGVVTAATAAEKSAQPNALKADDLIALLCSLDPAYQRNAVYMFNTKTMLAMRMLKDNSGQYLWQQNLALGAPATFNGKSYVINEDMDDIGTGNASVLCGDFSKFLIRQVKGYSVVRLDETYSSFLSTGFFGWGRFDSRLIDAGTHPIKKLVHE